LPGCPDIVFGKRHKIVFVHGCFWHGHDCPLFRVPKTRTEFWYSKIRKNQDRDKAVLSTLRGMGWEALVVWQCQLKDMKRCLAEVTSWLGTPAWGVGVAILGPDTIE
jgi:DNA mismatch endonuclease (patch repair protein)